MPSVDAVRATRALGTEPCRLRFFGILEGSLNPNAIGLRLGQVKEPCGRCSAAQSIGSFAVGVFANEEPPGLDAMSAGVVFLRWVGLPYPDSLTPVPGLKFAFC